MGAKRGSGVGWPVWSVIATGGLLGLILSAIIINRGEVSQGVLGLVVTVAAVTLATTQALLAQLHGTGAQHLEALRESIESLITQSALSDRAKSVLNRRAEADILRRAIDEEVQFKRWEPAMLLADELERRLGLSDLAESYRERITRAQSGSGIVEPQPATEPHTTPSAVVQEVASASAPAPQAPNPVRLELERKFVAAAGDGRADEAMELLKQLDPYLTPQEAEPLREQARQVINQFRDKLGAQFRLAVQERRWEEAMRAGEKLVQDFPNSRMASEARQVMENLRTKAGASTS